MILNCNLFLSFNLRYFIFFILVYSVQCTIYIVQCALYNLYFQCTIYITQHVYNTTYILNDIQCTYTGYNAHSLHNWYIHVNVSNLILSNIIPNGSVTITALHNFTPDYIALRHITPDYITLHYITSHYI